MKNLLILLLMVANLIGCNQFTKKKSENLNAFDVSNLKQLIINRGKSWGVAMQKKDISIIAELYDTNAHYLPDAGNTIRGIDAITEYWVDEIKYLTSIDLTMESLEGKKELLYETGKGVTKLIDSKGVEHTIYFKYVNVWKLNEDGVYRVVIDIYNNIKKIRD